MALVLLPRDVWLHRVLKFLSLTDLVRTESAIINHEIRATFLDNIHGSKDYLVCYANKKKTNEMKWRCARQMLPLVISFESSAEIDAECADIFSTQATLMTFKSCTFSDSDTYQRMLRASCHTLKSANYTSCTLHPTWSLKQCTNLYRVFLENCTVLSEDNFLGSLTCIPRLKSCTIYACPNITAKGFGEILESCKNLGLMHFSSSCNLTDVLVRLSAPIELKSFSAMYVSLDSESMRLISRRMPQLTSLSLQLYGWNVTTDADFDLLVRSCPHITSLSLMGFQSITNAALIHIAQHLPELTSFALQHSRRVTNGGLLTLVERCKLLTSLHLESLSISNELILAVGTHCRVLESLNVRDCANLTDGAFDTLNSDALTWLDVSRTNVTGAFVHRLFRKPEELYNLYCNNCSRLVSSTFTDGLAQCGMLYRLQLCTSPFSKSEWLSFAQRAPRIVNLHVACSPHVDEEVVRSFMKHPGLETVYAQGCTVPTELSVEFKRLKLTG